MATAAETEPRTRDKKAAATSQAIAHDITHPSNLVGRVSQVIGAVVDVAFSGELPRSCLRWRPTTGATASFSKLRSTLARM